MTTSNIANAKAPKQALAGVRVLDFSWAASGPLSTLYLSLLGAEVIKVESARSLDIARRGYYTVVDDINASPNFNDMHMGKLSIRLDLRHPKAKELVLRLVALCDAAVENFRPGTLDKFGLGYEALRQARPDLIMVSSSTAGQTGPERAMPGYATTFGALGGLGGVTGYRGGPATELWDSIDMRLGTSITLAALIGLYDRRRTGTRSVRRFLLTGGDQRHHRRLATRLFHDRRGPWAEGQRGRGDGAARLLPLPRRRPVGQHRGLHRGRVARPLRRVRRGLGRRSPVRRHGGAAAEPRRPRRPYRRVDAGP